MAFKLNPITGQLDLVGTGGGGSSAPNFSYTLIDVGQSIIIPSGQQMLYEGDLEIIGDLTVNGELTEINPDIYDAMSVAYVASGEAYLIPYNRAMLFKYLTIDGDMRIEGDLIEV